MRRSALLCALTFLLVTATPAVAVPAVQLVANAESSVGQDGDLRYSLPLAAPPGIGSAAPDLSLVYSSRQPDGRQGVGWTLQGSSAIARCSAIPAIDGYRGTVEYNAEDRYCLDGQRLINVQGAYGAAGSTYRTELETWRFVRASADLCGSGPCSFTVTNRAGGVSTYGTTGDSRIRATGRADVRVWALAESSDLNGNSVAFSYAEAPVAGASAADGEYYPARIDYTANRAAGFLANRSVRFVYAPRTLTLAAWQGGSKVFTRALLSNVRTYLGESVVRDVRLTYAEAPATGRPLLQRAEDCAGTGAAASCLSLAEAVWQGTAEIALRASDLGPRLAPFDQVLPMDVNGDGRGDLSWVTSDSSRVTVQALISQGKTLSPCASLLQLPKLAQARLVPAEVDRDSRADLVYVYGDRGVLHFALFPSDPATCGFKTGPDQSTGESSAVAQLWPMDANGDGLTDLVVAWLTQGRYSVATFLGVTGGFQKAGTSTIQQLPNERIWPAEVNGDGMLDLVQAWYQDGGALHFTTYLSNGRGFEAGLDSQVASGSVQLAGLWPMDVNGDGKTDLVQGWSQNGALQLATFLADGAGRFAAPTVTATGKGLTNVLGFWPMDANGDNRIDLVQAWQDGQQLRLIVYRNVDTGLDRGVAAGAALAVPDVRAVWPTDVDGDGKTDLVQADTVSPSPVTLAGYFSQGPIPDLISTLTDGAGGQIAATYLPLSDPAVYSAHGAPPGGSADARGYAYRQSPAQAPFQRVGGSSMQVVRRFEKRNDPARNASTYRYADTYTYAGGLVDVASGRGWLGFASFASLDEQTGRRSLTRLNQAFPLTGTTAEIAYQCDGAVAPDPLCPDGKTDTALSDSATSYQSVTTATGATSPFPKVLEILKQRVQINTYSYGTFDFSRAKEYGYDAYGNMTLIADLGYVDQAGRDLGTADDVFTCARYDDVDHTGTGGGWQLGYMIDRKVSSERDCTSFSTFRNGIDFTLEHFTYTPERDLASQATYDDVNRRDLVTAYTYDAYGNRLTETLPGNRTTHFAYEAAYHTYLATRTTPANEQGRRLVRTFGYDPRFGIKVAETTPNGRVRVQCLDEHGRIAAAQGPLPEKPAGVAADTNCVSTLVTGDAATFRSAAVVTLQTLERKSDAAHRLYREVRDLQAWTLPGQTASWLWSRDYFDGLGRRYLDTSQELPTVGQLATCTNFDDSDDPVRQSLPQYFPSDAIDCTSSGGNGMRWSTLTYDVYGRQIRQVDPAGPDGNQTAVTTMAYDQDLRVTVTRAADDSYRFRKVLDYDYYDSERKLRRMTLPDDGNATTTFDYDRIGRLTRVTDPPTTNNPDGVSNVLTYDSVGRRTSVDNPDQNTTPPGSGRQALALVYDPATGLLARSTDAKGQTTSFAYDALGRITRKTLPAGGGTVLSTYDDPARNGLGEQTSVSGRAADGSVLYAYDYGYDPYQNLVGTALTLGGTAYASSWVLDPQARTVQEIYPDGATVESSYVMGNLAEIREGSVRYALFEDYAPTGGPRRVTYGNDAAESYTYAPTGELTGQVVRDAAGSRLLDSVLDWDHLLELRRIDDRLKPGGIDFTQSFDHANTRLTGAVADGLYGRLSYGYDKSGNLVANDGYAYTYEAHRIRTGSGAGKPAFAADYDDNGNLIRRTLGSTAWAYTYDVRNRLTQAARDGVSLFSAPVYDDDGRRLRTLTADGVETSYVSPDYQVTRFPGGNHETTRYVTALTGLVATITVGQSGGAQPGVPVPGTLYFHRDHLGSTALTTGADGRLRTRLVYLPYGAEFPPGSSGPDDFRPKFQGKELDEDTALNYFGARYYDPVLGRFLTADTRLASDVTAVDAFNRFAFALNDPVTNIDPTGHAVWESILGATIGITEIALGVAIDVLSDGALEPIGGALIGAGINGIQYSATHSGSFSWQQYGIQQGEGAAFGLLTGGFGGEAEAGVEVAATEATESVAARSAAEETGELAAESEGQVLRSAADEGTAEEAADATAGREDFSLEGEESCTASFPAGTAVWTENGRSPIEQLVAGAVLVSRNSIDLANGFQPVTRATSKPVHDFVHLALRGEDGRGEELTTTPNHPLYVAGKGWTFARDLAAGDRVGVVGGGWALVEQAEAYQTAEPQAVHSLEIAGFRSYFVGALGVWVHNPCSVVNKKGTSPQGYKYDIELRIPRKEYPESAQHIEDAQAAGHDDVLTIERAGARANRRASLRGIKTQKGLDRDEYPPAMFEEGGEDADVELIDSSDNRASGSSFGGQLRSYPDYTKVWFHVVP